MRWISQSVADNEMLAPLLLQACKSQRIFLFFGTLGAGKTTLIKSICRALGVKTPVTSPTFTLVNEYEGAEGPVYHFDFYRIHREAEAEEIGFQEYLDSGQYCLIEWPEQVEGLLPADAARLYIETDENETRHLELICPA